MEADVAHVADMQLLMDDTEEKGKSPKKLNISGDAGVPVEPETLEPRVRLVRACGAVTILDDGQHTSPSSTTSSSSLRSSMRRQLALGKMRPTRALQLESLAQSPEVVEFICDECEEWHKGFRKRIKTVYTNPVLHVGVLPDWKVAQSTAKAITIGLYMEFDVHGLASDLWPVVWTRKFLFVYLPPGSEPCFGSIEKRQNHVVKHVGCRRLPREEGIACLAQVWFDKIHLGRVPDDAERRGQEGVAAETLYASTHFRFDQALCGQPGEDGTDLAEPAPLWDVGAPAVVHTAFSTPKPSPPTRPTSAARSGSSAPTIGQWLVDSGSALDLVKEKDVSPCHKHIAKGDKIRLETVNGETSTDRVLPLTIKSIDEDIQPHVLKSTPNLLSMGRRCILGGYAFHWPPHSHTPYFEHPETGQKVELQVWDFVPYLSVPDGDAVPRCSHARSAAGVLTAALNPSSEDDPRRSSTSPDLVDAEVDFLRARIAHLLQDRSHAAATTVADARKAGGQDPRLVRAQPGEGATSASSSGPREPEEPDIPPPPLPPPDVPDVAPPPAHALEAPASVDPVVIDDAMVDSEGWVKYDGTEKMRRDLKNEAFSLKHLLTHRPKNPWCPACTRAKMSRRPSRRQHGTHGSRAPPLKFGDLVNADHVIAHSEDAMGLTGERDALVIVDRYSKYVDIFPLKSKDADDAYQAFVEYVGEEIRPTSTFGATRRPS